MFDDFVKFTRELYQTDGFIPLHAPAFAGNEKKYLCDAIDSTFVSSVSDFVARFEQSIAQITGANHVIATMNGSAALHLALHSVGVQSEDEVLTQAFSFVATANAIRYCHAYPVFIDVSSATLGMSANSLEEFLIENAEITTQGTRNKISGRKLAACVPMHSFGHPVEIDRITKICEDWGIALVEDAAEAFGSFTGKNHCGNSGSCAALSFNGNKIITTGGGGAVITNDEKLAAKIRHIGTTAKVAHRWEYKHDELAFNYRMPGLNAALGCAQLESFPAYLKDKRELASSYSNWADSQGIKFIQEPKGTRSNYWLNALEFESKQVRENFLEATNAAGVMTRPPWQLLCNLPMYENCQRGDDLSVSRAMSEKIANVPSSPRLF